MTIKKRNRLIDIVKAIAILSVVFSHANSPYKYFFHLYHNSVFFICSGYCFSNCICSITSLKEYIAKKIKTLYIPFVTWSIIFLIIDSFLFKSISVFDIDNLKFIFINISKSFLFMGGSELSVAMWFLRILFQISILYAVIEYIICKTKINKKCSQTVISIVFLIMGYYMSINSICIAGIEITLSCYILYHFGVMSKGIVSYYQKINGLRTFVIGLFSILILLFFYNKKVFIDLASNSYVNPIYMLMCAIAGFLFLLSVSRIIEYMEKIEIIEYIGKNSLTIMILHKIFLITVATFYVTNWFISSIISVALSLIVKCLFLRIQTNSKYL